MSSEEKGNFGFLEIVTTGFLLLAVLVSVWAFYLDSQASTLKNSKIPAQKKNLKKSRKLIQRIKSIKKRAPEEAEEQEKKLRRLDPTIRSYLSDSGVANPRTVLAGSRGKPERALDEQPYIEGGIIVNFKDIRLEQLVRTLHRLERKIPVLKTYRIELSRINTTSLGDMTVKRGTVELRYYKPKKQ